MLDLGANVDCTPEQLMQFGVMGATLVAAIDGIARPTVGLLNIGEEDIKGNDLVKRDGGVAARDMRASISTATSKATISTRARPTSWSATASSATSR